MSKTECPHCHATNDVAPSHIGQYVTCHACGCKYYVYVPPLEKAAGTTGRIAEPPTPRPTEAPGQHSEKNVMMRQESLLADIHEDLVDLRRRITIACFLMVAAAAAVIIALVLR